MSRKKDREIIIYTLILHKTRKELGLSALEYCVADCIYHLANNPASKIKGWCYATKQTIANFFGITRRAVYKILIRLEKKKLVERNPDDRRYLRTTKKWYKKVILMKLQMRMHSEQSSHIVNKRHSKGEQSSRGNVNKVQSYKDNNKDNINIKKLKLSKRVVADKMLLTNKK